MPKQLPTFPKRLPNESYKNYYERLQEWRKEPVRSKGDLKDFKTGDFSLNREIDNA